MSAALLVVVSAGALIAAANGANDISKGIATLVGSGAANLRRATLWGTAWTALGGIAAGALAGAMVGTFGDGLLAAGTRPAFAAALGTIAGAAGWVLVATRAGLPVSTTHAIVGSLVGAGVVAYGASGLAWTAIGGKLALPLLVSPLAALGLTVSALRAARAVAGPAKGAPGCLCAELETAAPAAVAIGSSGAVALVPGAARLRVFAAPADACAAHAPRAFGVKTFHLHWLTSGAVAFARGLNDAPKMAALVLAATALSGAPADPALVFATVAAGMVAGGIVAGRRVTRLLAERVTPMDHREGLFASAVTSGLVVAGAVLGLPISTTHVSSGAIIGAGVARGSGSLERRTVRNLLGAWLVTLPASALLGALGFALARALEGWTT